MNKDTKNDRKSMISNGIDSLLNFNREMRGQFVIAGSDFTDVIQKLVTENEKLKANPKTPIWVIENKAEQIRRLVNFYTKTEEILEKYSQHMTTLQLTNQIIERTFLESKELDRLILSNKKLREEFIKP